MKKVFFICLILYLSVCLKAQNVISVDSNRILKNGIPWEFVGTVNMAVFSLPYDYTPQQSLGMDITRECIDMKLTSDADLQIMVTNAEDKGQVIILAGFWYDSDAFSGGTTAYPGCQLLGSNPQSDTRWATVMNRWKQIASLPFIKNYSNVWLNPWNEPYAWDGSNGYSNDMWESDAKAMIDSIRSTGANNIVVIEGSEMGQGHDVIVERGQNVKLGRNNIVFDIHTYNTRWNVTAQEIRSRFQAIRNAGNAFIVGEFANNGDEVWQTIMTACRAEKVSLLAWLWGQYNEPFATYFTQYCKAPRNLADTNSSISLDESLLSKISAFPNPFQNDICLSGLKGNKTLIEIYNTLGKLEFEKEIETAEEGPSKLPLAFLKTGLYVLNIKQENKISVLKILKY